MNSHGVDTATSTADAPSTIGAADALDLLAVFAALPGPAAVFAADAPRFTLLAASDALVAAAQRPREALVGRPLADAFPDHSPERSEGSGLASLRASLEAATRTRAPQRMARQRYDLRRPDGAWEARYWDALNTPVPGPGGAVRYVLHQTEDVTARVRAEEERGRLVADAARAERRAARVLEQVSDAVVQMDRAFRIVDVNPATERALGTPREQIVGRSHWEAFPGSAGTEPERQYRRVQAEGVEAHFTHHYVDAGRDFHAQVDAYPTDEGGVAIFWRDVSAGVRADAALRASESRYRALFESLDEGFCVIEVLFDERGEPVDYRFLETNPAFVEQTGLADAVGKRMRELVPGQDAHWFTVYGRVALTGTPTRFDAPAEALGRWYDVYAFRVGRPEERKVAVLFKDVSAARKAAAERERLLAALEVERARLAYVFRQAPAFLAVLRGPTYVFDLVNDAYYQLVGHREIIGKPVLDALPEVRGQGFDALLDGVYHMGQPFVGREIPVLLARTPGAPPEERFVDLTYMPLVEADGTRTGVIAHGTDVTAQVRARRDVERLYDLEQRARAAAEDAFREAEAANRAKGEFLAVMSHELRTPLNAIGGYAELIAMGIRGPVTVQQAEDLRRIQTSQRHLLGLINEVLNYAKLGTGTVHYAVADVGVREALAAAEALVAPQARAKGLAVTLADCPPALAARADPEKVRQVLVNLLSNAVKFTDPGGRIEMACAAEGARVVVRVRDTGIGVPADKLAAIFDPFVQVRADLTRTAEGTGLGLAISRDLARGMGGDLTAESTPGAGSTFTLTLPGA